MKRTWIWSALTMGLVSAPPLQARAETCELAGRVLDIRGQGVEALRVQALDGERKLETGTDDQGRFAFSGIEDSNPVRIVVWLASTSEARPYAIWAKGTPAALLSDTFTPSGRDCTISFDARAIPEAYTLRGVPEDGWPDALRLFQTAHQSIDLAERLGVQWTHALRG